MTRLAAAHDWLLAPDLSIDSDTIALRNALVVGESGLRDVGLRSTQGVVDVLPPNEVELPDDATLVSSDAAEIAQFLGRQARGSSPRPAVVTSLHSGTAVAALGAASLNELTASAVRASEGLVLMGFRGALEGDVRGGPSAAALQAWLRDAADSRAGVLADGRAHADFVVLLRSVEASSARVRVADHQRTKAQVDKLRSDNSRLERRYADLAASRLGRLTLKYWSWRGRIEARRAPSA